MRVIPVQPETQSVLETEDATGDTSRRTFGYRLPSRRTFGRGWPSRRTFGWRAPG
jgi:hypothetical protein